MHFSNRQAYGTGNNTAMGSSPYVGAKNKKIKNPVMNLVEKIIALVVAVSGRAFPVGVFIPLPTLKLAPNVAGVVPIIKIYRKCIATSGFV